MILVAGGTGRLGSRVANRLVTAGEQVRVLSRGVTTGDLPDSVQRVHGDVRRSADVAAALDGARVVVSAVQGMVGSGVSPRSVDRDGNRCLIAAAAEAGAEVVLLSVTHAAADSPLEVARMKHAAEETLASSGVPGTIVRAAAFTELWSEIVAQGRGDRATVFGRADRKVWWVSVEDVAAATCTAALDRAYRGRTVDVVGPDGLTLTELATEVMRARGVPGLPRRVPRAALHVGAATVGLVLPQVGRLLRASLAMDTLPPEDPEATRRAFPQLDLTSVADVLARRTPA